MNKVLLCLMFLPNPLWSEIRLTGIANLDGKGPTFSLIDTGANEQSGWIPIGSSFAGYKLAAFEAKTEILTLKGETDTLTVQLNRAVILDAGTQESTTSSIADQPPGARTDLASMTDEELKSRGLQRLRPGDTMFKIASQAGVNVKDLIALNPNIDPRKLRVGQIVRVQPESK